MTKITLSPVGSLIDTTTAGNTINNNFNTVKTAFDNTLSRDGTQPNQMENNFDMNNFQVLNLPTPATSQSPLRLEDLTSFVGGGTVTNIPLGGALGQFLGKNSSANFDVSWKFPDNEETYDPYNFGAKGDGVTDDSIAITNCITAARTAGATMIINDGNYKHNSTLNWAWNNFKVIAFGANVTFTHGGTGVGHQFSGMVNYPASQGCVGGVFGGPNRIYLVGNSSTTNLVLIDNWHFGYIKIAGKNATNAIVFCQDTGIVNASAVETTFDTKVSTNFSGPFTTVPWYGIRATALASCTFIEPIVESVGNVANSTTGISLVNCTANLFQGGTVESCLTGGISIGGTSSRNTFINVDAEVNGTQQDWIITGNNNTLINCSGAGTTSGQFVSGNYNTFLGGKYQSLAVQSGATGNTFNSIQISTAFADLGTDTSVINPDGIFTAQDYSAVRLGNKNFNTANNNTLFVNSKTVTDLSGTGSVLATTTSPVFITPALGTPASGVATNLTGTATGLTAGNATLAATVTTNANLTGDVTSVGNATTLTNAPVIAKVLTGYTSGAGTVSASDSILSAIQKLNGNNATNANLTGPIISVGNATSVAAQTGTGSTFVMNTSPTLVTPALGTPSSGTLTSCTGLPVSGVTGLGTNVATALGTTLSATGGVAGITTGSWTPIDSSGATLAFTGVNAAYTKIGNIVHAYGTLTFPSTASASVALIGGLPFTVANATYATVPSPVATNAGITGLLVRPIANTTTFNFYNNATGTNNTNVGMTVAVCQFNITYTTV